jgi:hypothetical protein
MRFQSGARRRRRSNLISIPPSPSLRDDTQAWIEPEDVQPTIPDGGELVDPLPDETGNGDDLLTSTSGAAKPKLFHNIISGKAIARSGGADDGFYRTTVHSAEFTLVMLMRVLNAVNNATVIDFQVAGGVLQQNTTNGGFKYNQAFGGAVISIAATMTNWNTIVVRAKQTENMLIRINGAQQALFAPHNNLYLASTTDFCKSATSEMELAAFGKWDIKLADADILDVEDYMKKKFKHYT